MFSKQLIVLCIISTLAKACENPALKGTDNTETTTEATTGETTNSTETSREKRAAQGGGCLSAAPSSCKYCEGTLDFIPNIQGRRKKFE